MGVEQQSSTLDFKDKKIIARFDFNVPLGEFNEQTGVREILDTTRIDLTIPTLENLLERGASKIIMMSHLGRPKGKENKELSLEPIARYIAKRLGQDVYLSESALDSGIKTLANLNHVKLILLENLRFHPEEISNDQEFAKTLSSYGDIYLNDAFGAAHRKHASVHAINAYFDKNSRMSGFLLSKEIRELQKIATKPATPFVAIIGGAKVQDKIKTIEKLLLNVDKLLIGGAMAYPFLKAKGIKVGKSLCSSKDVELAQRIIKQDKGNKIELPLDHILAKSIDAESFNSKEKSIDDEYAGFDIGERTIAEYERILLDAKTIFWNGPMGLFEKEEYSHGSIAIARILAKSKAYTLVGGGDSVSALNKSGFSNEISHISTGGGASLEFIEQGSLPGISALKFGV